VPPLIAIPATDISADGMELEASLPTKWLDSALRDADTVSDIAKLKARSQPQGGKFGGRLSRSGKDIVVHGRVSASLTVTCVRCLQLFPVYVDAELALLLQPSSQSELRQPSDDSQSAERASEAYEFSADEAQLDVYDGETVVLDGFLREAILLDLPNFPLCSDSCPGIRPDPPNLSDQQNGPVEPVDPRLAPLGVLRAKMTGAPLPADQAQPGQDDSSNKKKKPILRSSTRRGLKKKKKRE